MRLWRRRRVLHPDDDNNDLGVVVTLALIATVMVGGAVWIFVTRVMGVTSFRLIDLVLTLIALDLLIIALVAVLTAAPIVRKATRHALGDYRYSRTLRRRMQVREDRSRTY